MEEVTMEVHQFELTREDQTIMASSNGERRLNPHEFGPPSFLLVNSNGKHTLPNSIFSVRDFKILINQAENNYDMAKSEIESKKATLDEAKATLDEAKESVKVCELQIKTSSQDIISLKAQLFQAQLRRATRFAEDRRELYENRCMKYIELNDCCCDKPLEEMTMYSITNIAHNHHWETIFSQYLEEENPNYISTDLHDYDTTKFGYLVSGSKYDDGKIIPFEFRITLDTKISDLLISVSVDPGDLTENGHESLL